MPDKFLCPRCGIALEQVRMEHGVFWLCRACGGRALSAELLRRTFARESINSFWSRVISGAGKPSRPCPCCRHAMTEVALADHPEAPAIDVCRLCHFVWFDASEVAGLQPLPVTGSGQGESAAAREARALAKVTGMAFEAERPEFDAWWVQLIRSLGMWI